MSNAQFSSLSVPRSLLFILCFLICVLSCQDPFTAQKQGGHRVKPPDGTGSFLLRVAAQDGRTILPIMPVFESYRLAFTNASAPNNTVTFNLSAAEAFHPVRLPTGVYSLTVTAFTDAAHVHAAAQGTLAEIAITEGAAAEGVVILRAIIDEGEGTFAWNFKIAITGLTRAEMIITPLSAGTAANPIARALLPESHGSVALSAGYYRVTVELAKNDGRRIALRETLHVYQNMASAW